ncbi:MAG: nitroreductase family protein [Candidatus Ratteibacteria bacterium]|nr:nitroreductase family protein [Candidatus Ratteibacteria bacterium]
MNVYEAINKRRSVRAYKNKPIPEDILNKILEAARLAPTAKNRQQFKLIVVTNPETIKKLVEVANNQQFVGEASAVIAAVGLTPNDKMRCGIPTDPIDVAIAIDHITLAAVEEGLGTCWIGSFFQDKACQLLGIPSSYKVVELLTLGYPADSPRPKTRKSLNEIICYEKFC